MPRGRPGTVRRDTIMWRVLEALEVAPATSGDIKIELEIDRRIASTFCRKAVARGFATRSESRHKAHPGERGAPAYLYTLTDRGLEILQGAR